MYVKNIKKVNSDICFFYGKLFIGDIMKKILFVCYGNICRSPMAEFIFKNMVEKKNISNEFIIESKATSNEEIGNDMYYLAKEKLLEKNIPFTKRNAKKLTKNDYDNYDYIIGMADYNIKDIMDIIIDDPNNKVYKLLDFMNIDKDIVDPWHTRDFETAYNEIFKGCEALLKTLQN